MFHGNLAEETQAPVLDPSAPAGTDSPPPETVEIAPEQVTPTETPPEPPPPDRVAQLEAEYSGLDADGQQALLDKLLSSRDPRDLEALPALKEYARRKQQAGEQRARSYIERQQQAEYQRQELVRQRTGKLREILTEAGLEVDASKVSEIVAEADQVLSQHLAARHADEFRAFLAGDIVRRPEYAKHEAAIGELLRDYSAEDWTGYIDAAIELGRLEERARLEPKHKAEVNRLAKEAAEAMFKEKMNAVKTEPTTEVKGAPPPSGTDEERLNRIVMGQPTEDDKRWYEERYGRSSRSAQR